MTAADPILVPPLSELLDQPLTAALSTVSPSGLPQSSLVWFERRGEKLVLFAEDDTVKVRNLRHRPDVVLLVVDPVRALGSGVPAYVRLTGKASLRPGEPGLPDRLAVRYGNSDGYPWPLGPYSTIEVAISRVGGLGPYPTRRLGGWAPKAAGRG
jgi:PPOX class probable F420-dependent enzyme